MKILLLDDDAFKRSEINEILKTIDKNVEITECIYGNDGLQELNKNIYDLMVLDMQFPNCKGEKIERKNGISILKQIRALGNNIPVIICSCGYEDCSEYQIAGYIIFGNNSMPEHFKQILERLNIQEQTNTRKEN